MALFKKFEDNRKTVLTGKDPEKKGVMLYFELFSRKFWNYIKLNMLYFLTSIVSFLIYWSVFSMAVVPLILDTIPGEVIKMMADSAGRMSVYQFKSAMLMLISIIGALLMVAFFGGGVFSAGYNYILRNYVRQENAFFLSDYFGQTKKNFKQALVVSVIDKIVVSLCLFSLAYYFHAMKHGGGVTMTIAFAVLLFALLVYAAMHIYIWTIMITFKVSLKQLFKNSLMLTMGTAVRTIGYIIGIVAFSAIMLTIFAYFSIVAFALFFVIAIAAFNLAGHMCSYPVIKKYMIDNNNKNEEGIEG